MSDATTLTPADSIELVPFTPDHLPEALILSQAVGWPHREEDWRLTMSVSRGVAAVQDGAVVGTALCSDFGSVASLNMIIVADGMRGAGLGRRLMEAVLKIAGGRECRLVGTEMGLPLYRKLGFEATGQILQYQGTAVAAAPEQPVHEGDPAGIAALAEIDSAATGLSRAELLATIAETGTLLETEGGFALLRPFGRGHVVGPVIARTDAAARALMAEAATRCASGFLRIDMPEARAVGSHAEALGLAYAGGGTAMARGARPIPPSDHKTYALISQALG